MKKIWFNKEIKEITKELNTNIKTGLTNNSIKENLEKYGYNQLKEAKKIPLFIKFLEQFKDFMIIVLIIAAIIAGIVGTIEGEGITDTIIILIVVVLNAIIGIIQEAKAEKSLEALQKLSSHVAKVIRNNKLEVIESKKILPGDIVILETGDYVPADIRLIEAINLKSQESSLTGESLPVEKNIEIIEDETIGIGDVKNMVFSSSLITYGRGMGIVVETGMNTEVGKIADILSNTIKTETPLQIKLNKLGKTLGVAALFVCILIFFLGLAIGKAPLDMFMSSVSLAVAAIPEGLAAVSTIVLAIGVQRMVKKNAIVKKLPAVETLGSATVICSDKTGTLTQNKMTVKKLFVNSNTYDLKKVDTNNKEVSKLVYTSILCNDTKISIDNILSGDPTETALIDMALKLKYDKNIITDTSRIKEIPFDSTRKLMTTVVEVDGKYIVYTKGGIDELLKCCSSYIIENKINSNIEDYKNIVHNHNENMAQDALRVLGMAYKELDYKPTNKDMKGIEKDLIFIGMVGMIDPPRIEVKKAVATCRKAGIKTVMITGDHKITAVAIAKELGILKTSQEAITGKDLEAMSQEDLEKNIRKYSVYARVSPEHKVRIVKAWQSNNEIVAMTGDGVNDAPALKTADIGCAMGIVGTDVAKEAADVILTDDNFATIVESVKEGRRIYDNIIKAIQFLLSSNVGEVVALFTAILLTPWISSKFGIDITHIEILLPVHILWINLVTDSFPALALAIDPAESDIMNRKPVKASKGVFTKGITRRVIYQGIMIGLITIGAFLLGLSTPTQLLPSNVVINDILLTEEEIRIEMAQAMAFVVLAISQLVHVFNIRNSKKTIFGKSLFNNKLLLLANFISFSLMMIIFTVEPLRIMFSIPIVVYMPTRNIILTILLIFVPLVVVELAKLFKLNTTKDE